MVSSSRGVSAGMSRGCSLSYRWAERRYVQSEGQSMVTSRSLPQQTAQIFSALAGQKRSALRFSQIGQDTKSPQRVKTVQQNTLSKDKRQKPAIGASFIALSPGNFLVRACVPSLIMQTEHTQSKTPEWFIVVGASLDRKSTRLNSSHRCISYAVF